MPWELNISKTATASEPLGPLHEVQASIALALPGTNFYREPSGKEQLAHMEAEGVQVPDAMRAMFARSTGSNRGDFEGADFSFEFYLGKSDLVKDVLLDVRGSGDPLPAIAQLIKETGWTVFDLATSQPVKATGWEKFVEWRDRNIRAIQQEDQAGEE